MKISVEYLERIKAQFPLSQVIGRDVALHRAGSEWKACCPFHDEKTPSFFVNDRKGHFWCFGCGAHGDAIAWFMRHRRMTFEGAVEALAGEKPPSDAQRFEDNIKSRAAEAAADRWKGPYPLDEDQRSRQSRAQAIWYNAKSFEGSLGETYLRSRSITLRRWPSSLAFTPDAWHGWERTRRPALIGCVQDAEGGVTAVQTIFLRPDGRGKAGITPPKPVTGPMVNGAVRLGDAAPMLGIAEGIETALSARQIFSLPVWATLGASRLGAVKLPDIVREVIIFADNGESGRAAADKAARAYMEQDRTFLIQYPPDEFSDFNDWAQQRSRAA